MNDMELIQASIEQLERVSKSIASIGETEDYTEVAIQALEKQMPKKPVIKRYDGNLGTVHCPNCNHDLFSKVYKPWDGWNDAQKSDVCCSQCGQKLDWSDEP